MLIVLFVWCRDMYGVQQPAKGGFLYETYHKHIFDEWYACSEYNTTGVSKRETMDCEVPVNEGGRDRGIDTGMNSIPNKIYTSYCTVKCCGFWFMWYIYLNLYGIVSLVQGPSYDRPIDQSYKSNNASIPYPTIQHSEQKCVLWDMQQVHCGNCEIGLLPAILKDMSEIGQNQTTTKHKPCAYFSRCSVRKMITDVHLEWSYWCILIYIFRNGETVTSVKIIS